MKKLLVLIALVLTTQPAWAQVIQQKAASPKNELVYRVNLGRADDVKYLLEHGSNANQKDEKGTPLLALASSRLDKEGLNVVKTLLELGADINGKDAEGKSALFYAARKGNKDIVQFLLESKINYYAVDYAGNIARTIAYREGHNDIVKQMDDFVKGETEKISEQYRQLSKALEEQYKAQEDAQRKTADAATQQALEQSRQLSEQRSQQHSDQKQKHKNAIDDLETARASEAFTQARFDLAFHSCAFQYWSFCQSANQTTGLTPEALQGAINSHESHVLELKTELETTYKTGKKYTDNIIKAGQESVYNQLAAMPSKIYRFEQGVCKMDDLVKRCNDIAKYPGTVTTKGKKAPAAPLPPGRGTQRHYR